MFSQWLRKAAPGERFIYYRGYYLKDRCVVDEKRDRDAEDEFARAWGAHLKGRVRLFQKRLDKFDYEYIAVKT